ncbi:hypothetical protein DHW03_18550 [Pedobacter yonginense]|uniref:Uncharacterized protein n=1 Tax=Pedobacter yonginense TaxID=651869 RepID=A0A317EIU2_9SPHI|nr:hypothetical protein DHW03_18550 [Pedobacter yonginense]
MTDCLFSIRDGFKVLFPEFISGSWLVLKGIFITQNSPKHSVERLKTLQIQSVRKPFNPSTLQHLNNQKLGESNNLHTFEWS